MNNPTLAHPTSGYASRWVWAAATLVTLLLIAAAMVIISINNSARQDRHGYLADLRKAEQQLSDSPANSEEQAYWLFNYAQLTGNFDDYARAESLLKTLPDTNEALYLRARIALHMHELAEAEKWISVLQRYADPRQKQLNIHLAIQQKQWTQAHALLQSSQGWLALAHLATLAQQQGQTSQADTYYQQAQDLLSVKELKDYAWLELQRGILDLQADRLPAATAHFVTANRIYPGHWLIEEHLAETYALQGESRKAIQLYEGVIQRSDNPLYLVALSELIQAQNPKRAKALLVKARDQQRRRTALYPLAVADHGLFIPAESQ